MSRISDFGGEGVRCYRFRCRPWASAYVSKHSVVSSCTVLVRLLQSSSEWGSDWGAIRTDGGRWDGRADSVEGQDRGSW